MEITTKMLAIIYTIIPLYLLIQTIKTQHRKNKEKTTNELLTYCKLSTKPPEKTTKDLQQIQKLYKLKSKDIQKLQLIYNYNGNAKECIQLKNNINLSIEMAKQQKYTFAQELINHCMNAVELN